MAMSEEKNEAFFKQMRNKLTNEAEKEFIVTYVSKVIINSFEYSISLLNKSYLN